LLREVLCFTFGTLILIANTIDLAWTSLGTHGGGPISTPITDGIWDAARALHKRWPSHKALSFVGSIAILALLMFWVAMLWSGWFLILSARPDAIIDAKTHQPADAAQRIYFTAYAISTMGNGDYAPSGDLWRLLVSLATIGGLGTMSMAITFLMNVLPAVVVTRSLASYMSDLGETPQKILARSWTGENFDSLNDHFLQLTGMIHTYTEQHLAYPVLQYFHSEHERTSAPLRLACLNEIIFLLCHGAAENVRPSPMVILPLNDALEGMADVIQGTFVHPADEAPPLPPLAVLRDLNVPTVDDVAYFGSAKQAEATRRFFAGMLENEGWPWARIWEGHVRPRSDV
jgi:hypothetical protein